MTGKEKTSEHERRDWTIILIILLFGFLCVILAGQQALRFSPRWKLDTSMQSNLDPNSDFLTNRPVGYFEPLDPSILTQPAWINVFLTPGAFFEPRTPVAFTNTPLPTNTPVLITPTAVTLTNTPTVIPVSPTNTLIYYPPPPTRTSLPPPPTNTPLPAADLYISKDDTVTYVNPGDTVTYTVRVTNNGPSNVTGAILSDPAVSGLSKTVVACSLTPGQCISPPTVVQLESGAFALPTLNIGQFYEITITVNITASSGSVTNIATITAPAGISDPTPGNNSVSDTDVVNMVADLSIAVTDNSTHYVADAVKVYEIVVSNAGPSNVVGAAVTNIFSNGNIDPSTVFWGCIPSAGASCTSLGVGSLANELVNLNSGSSVTFYVTAQAISAPVGNLVNDVSVTVPGGITDPGPGVNSATDIDILITADTPPPGIEIGTGPNNNYYGIPAGSALTFSVSLIANGDAGPDLVVYEYNNAGTVFLDWMIVQVGDGSNWYTVFYWGDDLPDTNTNLDFTLLPPLSPPEPDERPIPATTPPFYNNHGIAIDIDAIVSSGTYQWLRIVSPIDNNDNQVEIDAVEFLP